ncbi:MAG: porin [Alphaproteobacteria bacterium]|jgi:predicted porin
MRKILLGTTAVVGLALLAPVANAQQARPAARPAAAPAAPPALPATSVAPTGTAAALFQTPVGITGAGPHGADGIPNRPTTPTTSGIIVRLGGFFDFSMGNVSDDADRGQFRNTTGSTAASTAVTNFTTVPLGGVTGNYTATTAAAPLTTARGRQRNDFRTEAELNVYADGVAANGMRYGAVLELQMDNLAAGSGTGVDYDELYGFVKGSWGELRFGQEDHAANLMQVRRPGTLWMGSDDAWDEFVVQSGTFGSAPYIMSGITDGSDATKLIYLSPQFMGFDVGASYAPNSGEGERTQLADSTTTFQRDRTSTENQISAALRYRGTFGDVGVQTAMTGYWADAAQLTANGAPIATKAQNISAYLAGLVVRAYGFQLGGEYAWGNYNQQVGNGALAAGLDGSSHWLLGAVYTIGAFSVGAQYGKGTQDNGTSTTGAALSDRTQTYLGFGVSYTLAPGMTLFANYNQVEDENLPNASGPSVRNMTAGTGGTTLANFGTAANPDNTRDIQVLVAGVRIAF